MSERSDQATEDSQSEEGQRDTLAGVEFTHPQTVAIDQPFRVGIDGIESSEVNIDLSLVDAEGTEWTATESTQSADSSLQTMDSIRDSGIPRLIQRATPSEDGARYAPPRGDGEELTVAVEADGTRRSTTIERTFGSRSVERDTVENNDFVGTVYYPPGREQAPAVVALHGSDGQPADATARLLASHGFVVLALHYFDWRGRHEMLPRELVDVPLSFVDAAVDWLREDSRVAGSRVGLWGVSKGGELALLAGARLDAVGPVVSVNGSGIVWQGFSQGQTEQRSSWIDAGQSVPYVPYTSDQSVWNQKPPMELEPAYSASYREASQDEIERATIPVESIDGPVLLVSGGDDSMWDSATLQGIAADRLARHDCAHEHLVYDSAGHAITYPYLPTANRTQTRQFVMGGTPAGDARAARDHWPRVRETFDTLR